MTDNLAPWQIGVHLTREELVRLFAEDKDMLTIILTDSDNAYRSLMSQVRFVDSAAALSSRGYYKRKPPHPAVAVMSRILNSLSMLDQHKLRNTLSYLRSEYKRTHREGETVAEKRARYQREYYARRKREKKLELVRVVLPRLLYKEVCDTLDAAGRPDLTEQVMTCKVNK